MTQTTKPDKLTVREYMERRTHQVLEAPPTPEEIRTILGWRLIPANGKVPEVPD